MTLLLEPIPAKMSVLPFFLPQKDTFSSVELEAPLGASQPGGISCDEDTRLMDLLIPLNLPSVTLIDIPGPGFTLLDSSEVHASSWFPVRVYSCRPRAAGFTHSLKTESVKMVLFAYSRQEQGFNAFSLWGKLNVPVQSWNL